MKEATFWKARLKDDMHLLKLSVLIPGVAEERGKRGPRTIARSVVESNGDVRLTITSANLRKVLKSTPAALVLSKVTSLQAVV